MQLAVVLMVCCPLAPLGGVLAPLGGLIWPEGEAPEPPSGGDGDENESAVCTWGPGAWSHEQVLAWLGSLGAPFEKYVAKFQENGVDGEVLVSLSKTDLTDDFGIQNKYHMQKIWRSLQGMKKDCQVGADVRAGGIDLKEVAATHFDGRVSRVVFSKLAGVGLRVEKTIQAVGEDVCSMMQDVEREVLRLETTEKLTHFVLHQTSDGDPDSLMSSAKQDLPKIMNAKSSARAAFHGLKTGLTGLVFAISSFGKRIGAKLPDHQKKYELELLGEAFVEWKTNAESILVNLFNASSELEERAKLRTEQMKVGGAAVQSNMVSIDTHARQLQEARQEHASIVAADPAVAMAVEARSGELAVKLRDTESQISALEAEVLNLKRILEDKVNVANQVAQFVLEQNKKKQEWRDWHIRWCWANVWGPEMEKYDAMADRNIAEQDKERARAEAAQQSLHRMLEQYQGRIGTLQKERATMIGVSSTWEATLEKAGVTAKEDTIRTHSKALRIAESSLRTAMAVAGVSNAEDAAKAIMASHRATIMLSQAASKAGDVAHRVRGHAKKFDNIIKRIQGAQSGKSSLEFLKTELEGAHEAFKLIGDGHELRMANFEDSSTKAEMMRALLDEDPVGHSTKSTTTMSAESGI